jgi:hypothetical protein
VSHTPYIELKEFLCLWLIRLAIYHIYSTIGMRFIVNKKNDGLKIMVCTFSFFFLLAFAGIKIEEHYGWNKPDLESCYWIENGHVYIRKGSI